MVFSGLTRARPLVRMFRMVMPHSKPLVTAIRSPSIWSGLALNKPSLSASPTEPKANISPSHCKRCKRSLGTKRGKSRATTKGAMYQKTV